MDSIDEFRLLMFAIDEDEELESIESNDVLTNESDAIEPTSFFFLYVLEPVFLPEPFNSVVPLVYPPVASAKWRDFVMPPTIGDAGTYSGGGSVLPVLPPVLPLDPAAAGKPKLGNFPTFVWWKMFVW